MLCSNVNVYIFGYVFKNYLHRLTATFSYFLAMKLEQKLKTQAVLKSFGVLVLITYKI